MYAGRHTKRFLKVQLLEKRKFEVDKLRWAEWQKSVKYIFHKNEFDNYVNTATFECRR